MDGSGNSGTARALAIRDDRPQHQLRTAETGPLSCIHELIESQARRAPDKIALVDESRSISLGLLNEQANRLAARLRSSGASPEVLIGLYVDRSLEAASGLLAILKAGAAYVPLDPHYPAARVAGMIEDSELGLMLTESRFIGSWPGHSGLDVLSLDKIPAPSADRQFLEDALSHACVDNAAFVIFTSGSTGRPKGTVVTHRSLISRLASVPLPDIQPQDICAWNSSLNFGISSSRLLLPLAMGATVVVLSEAQSQDVRKFASAVEKHQITSFFAVPSFLRQLLVVDSPIIRQFRSVRAIASGGGAFTPDLFEGLSERLPHVQFINLYGSTEIGTTASLKVLQCGQPVTIGTPVEGMRVYVLDSNLAPVPDGTVGELYVGSSHLARGYLNQPDLTAECFLASPFVRGERICRTGDLGTRLPNGEIEFAGRIDNQVKIRGFRIELEEIESVLLKHPAVLEVGSRVHRRATGERLVAYLVPKPGMSARTDELRGYLSATLPDYMVPSAFIFLERLPLTSAGKLDRKALPDPPVARPDLSVEFQPPHDSTESALAHIWSDVLCIEPIGVHDDFLALGGDSLSAAQVLFRVSETFHVDLSIEEFHKHATVAAVARLVREGLERNATPTIVERIPRGGDLPLSFHQEFMLASELQRDIRGMNPWSPNTGFGFVLEGEVDRSVLEDAVQQILSRHEALRTGFHPTASIGALQLEGWQAIRQLFGNGPLRPKIRFTGRHLSPRQFHLEFCDLSRLNPVERAAEIRKLTREAIETPHDYASSLLRGKLIRTGSTTHHLIFGISHLVFDGWSRGIFQRELAAFYRQLAEGVQCEPPELPVQYAEFAHWQRQRLQGSVLRDLVDFWKGRFEAYPALDASDIPGAREAAHAPGAPGRMAVRTLPAPLHQAVRSFIARNQTTLYTLLFTAITLVMHFYTKRERISLGAYFANRVLRETAHLIGDFATFQAVGVTVPPAATVRDLIADVRDSIAQGAIHQELPYGLFLNAVAQDRRVRLPQSPPVSCELIGSAAPSGLPSLTIRRMDRIQLLSDLSRCQAPLRILCYEQDDEDMKIAASYHVTRFESSTIEAMLGRIAAVLDAIVRAPGSRVSSLASFGATP